jgi:uncharacterized protein (DUF58 family)
MRRNIAVAIFLGELSSIVAFGVTAWMPALALLILLLLAFVIFWAASSSLGIENRLKKLAVEERKGKESMREGGPTRMIIRVEAYPEAKYDQLAEGK